MSDINSNIDELTILLERKKQKIQADLFIENLKQRIKDKEIHEYVNNNSKKYDFNKMIRINDNSFIYLDSNNKDNFINPIFNHFFKWFPFIAICKDNNILCSALAINTSPYPNNFIHVDNLLLSYLTRSNGQFTPYTSNFSEYDILHHIKKSSYTISDQKFFKENIDYIDIKQNIFILQKKSVGAANYFHFFYDFFPYVRFFIEEKQTIKDLKLFLNIGDQQNWIQDLFFDILKFKQEDFFYTDKPFVNSEITLIPSFTSNEHWENKENRDYTKQFFQKNIIDKVLSKNIESDYDRILLIRNNDSKVMFGKRIFSNRNEIVNITKKYGFHDIDTTKLNLSESINLHYKAKYLIIENGAGVINLGWCNPDTTIIILQSGHRCKVKDLTMNINGWECYNYIISNINNNNLHIVSSTTENIETSIPANLIKLNNTLQNIFDCSTSKIINTLRTLSIDMINKANSGHPGMAIGCAPMMYILWCKIMNFNPEVPNWSQRDRFILSNGHGCALLYSMLHLLGYNYSIDDLKNFRQIGSKTPGHPEFDIEHGIETSTGPLGQGFANGVGMAIAAKKQKLNNTIYVMCGDGCLMEGVSYESASLAGHLELNNLIVLYDDNNITIDGNTNITFTENTRQRFEACNWEIFDVEDGNNDIGTIEEKILGAKNSNKPAIIFVKTTIGYGTSLANSSACHGAPLGEEKTKELKQFLNCDENKTFHIEEDVLDYFKQLKQKKIEHYNSCDKIPNIENNFEHAFNSLDLIKDEEKNYATRQSSGIVLKKLGELLPNLLVGSADLAESNKTMINKEYITKDNFDSNYINYGIREHAMCSIANGLSTFGILPVVSTFLIFITYCLAPIRMAALSNHKVLFVLTHDSVFLGEDGPTHQPIESLTILRSIPNLLVIRPCDTTEVCGAYKIALEHNGPSVLILSRQTLPNIEKSNIENIKYGAYIVYEPETTINKIIIATGSEVSLAIDVAKELNNVRVVSMPCCELFDLQNNDYKEQILPKEIQKISLEAGATIGWYKYANYVYGIDTFGNSGNINDLKTHFGFEKDKLIKYLKN